MGDSLRAGRAFFDLVPRLRAGTERDIERQLGGVDGFRPGHAVGSKFTDGFKRAAIGLGAFFAAKVGADLFTGAVNSASDLNETLSKSRTIFGDGADDIERWGEGAAEAIGQSKRQAVDAAATFGNLFVQLGIGDKAAAGMSKKMVELASDFASFHNADISEVIAAQSAAFRGEYDAVQRFVPTITAATVEQKALALTHKATTKELTAQDKALATQALLLEGAGDAAGDFARTSDGLANKQRILSAKFEDVKAKIGAALIPVVTKLVSVLADNLEPAMDGIARVARPIVDAVGTIGRAFQVLAGDDGAQGFGEIMDSLLGNSGEYVGLFRTIGTAIRDLATFIGDNLKPILIGLGAAFAVLISPIGAVVAALIYAYTQSETFRAVIDTVVRFLVDVVVPAVVAFVTAVAEQFGHLVAWVQEHWAAISEAISHVVTVIRTVVEVAVNAILLFWRYFGDTILAIIKGAWDQIRAVIEFGLDFISGLIEVVTAVINGDWGAAWDAIVGILSSAWDLIKTLVGSAIDVVKALIGDGLTAAKDIVLLQIDAIVGFFADLPGRLSDAAGDLFSWIRDKAKEMADWVIKQVDRALGPLDEIAGKVGGVLGKVGGFVGKIPGLARGGDVVKGGLTWVGEQGPELLDLDAGSRVTPLSAVGSMIEEGTDERRGPAGPLIAIGEATFEDEVDLDLLLARASFATSEEGFG